MPKVLKNDVTVSLRELIQTGELEADTHLQEMQLAEQFGVSRTPIRAALNSLAAEGLLVPGPWKGYKVRQFTFREVHEAYVVRAALESTACRSLAEAGIGENDSRRLWEILDHGQELLSARRQDKVWLRSWLAMNRDYHQTLIDLCGNAMLAKAIRTVQSLPIANPEFIAGYQLKSDFMDRVVLAHEDHVLIVQAVEARQSARAEALMREHVTRAGERSVSWLRDVTSEAEASDGSVDAPEDDAKLDLRALGTESAR